MYLHHQQKSTTSTRVIGTRVLKNAEGLAILRKKEDKKKKEIEEKERKKRERLGKKGRIGQEES